MSLLHQPTDLWMMILCGLRYTFIMVVCHYIMWFILILGESVTENSHASAQSRWCLSDVSIKCEICMCVYHDSKFRSLYWYFTLFIFEMGGVVIVLVDICRLVRCSCLVSKHDLYVVNLLHVHSSIYCHIITLLWVKFIMIMAMNVCNYESLWHPS